MCCEWQQGWCEGGIQTEISKLQTRQRMLKCIFEIERNWAGLLSLWPFLVGHRLIRSWCKGVICRCSYNVWYEDVSTCSNSWDQFIKYMRRIRFQVFSKVADVAFKCLMIGMLASSCMRSHNHRAKAHVVWTSDCPLSLLQVWAGVWPTVRVQIRSISSVISWSPWHWWKRSEHRSKNYKPTTPDQPTVTRTRRGDGWWGVPERAWATVGMKGEKMKIWRLAEYPRGETWKSRVLGWGSSEGG